MPAKREPQVRYEGETWHVTLPPDDGKAIDATWRLPRACVVRIGEAGTDRPWSFGFRTPWPAPPSPISSRTPDTSRRLRPAA